MKRLLAAAAAAVLAILPAFAQQAPPDPAFLQRALAAVQAQRNAALDDAAGMRAQYESTLDQLAIARTRINDLEAKARASTAPSPPPETPK